MHQSFLQYPHKPIREAQKPFLSSVPLCGMTFPFLSIRNLWNHLKSNLKTFLFPKTTDVPYFPFPAAVFIRLCVRASVYALRIVSMDTILRFINILNISIIYKMACCTCYSVNVWPLPFRGTQREATACPTVNLTNSLPYSNPNQQPALVVPCSHHNQQPALAVPCSNQTALAVPCSNLNQSLP